MLKKQMRLMVTFENTVDAMRMENYCEKENIKGRLIPVPRQITAGCGLCYMTLPDNETEIDSVLTKYKLDFHEKIKMMF